MTHVGGLDELRPLRLELRERLLRVPVPGRVGGEQQVHLFERALVALGVERPDDGDGYHVARPEDMQRVLANGVEHHRAQQRQPPISYAPSEHAPRVALGSYLEREDLGWVEPSNEFHILS